MSALAQQLDFVLSSGLKQQNRSQLETMIDMACDIQHPEPDLTLNLEIVDFINTKQKNYPHEAAFAIVHYVNSRDTHQAMLALSLLDQCVKNCGFPFHLQISTKEFLNELVKQFPERPPSTRTAVQERILDLLQLWNLGIFEVSKYKQDLVHINDMFRLLRHKGYRFPPVKQDSVQMMIGIASVISPSQGTFKTADELQNEDRLVQSAKLQELLRRGRPADLAEANELMKVMAGYYHDEAPNYDQMENDMIRNGFEKTDQLRDLLIKIEPSVKTLGVRTTLTDNRDVQDLLSSVKSSQPKILKWIDENSTDSDGSDSRIERLLQLNDQMNEVLQAYENLKNGKPLGLKSSYHYTVDSAAQIKSDKNQQKNNESLLIELDDVFDPLEKSKTQTEIPKQSQQPLDLLSELSGLKFSPSKQ